MDCSAPCSEVSDSYPTVTASSAGEHSAAFRNSPGTMSLYIMPRWGTVRCRRGAIVRPSDRGVAGRRPNQICSLIHGHAPRKQSCTLAGMARLTSNHGDSMVVEHHRVRSSAQLSLLRMHLRLGPRSRSSPVMFMLRHCMRMDLYLEAQR